MPITDQFKDNKSLALTKRLIPWTICVLLPMALIHSFFYPLPFSPSPKTDLPHSTNNNITYRSSLSASPPSSAEKGKTKETKCDYCNGEWVSDSGSPLYNDTTCGTIKEGRNCITHGRPESGYLHWRWKPTQCNLPRFEPQTFLQHIKNKHVAFVGDSMARNQLESLLCMLATASTPNLVYNHKTGKDNQFSRWHFPSHNASVSLYWSPFLVHGVEKSSTNPNNNLYLDHVDERWANDMDQMDLIVLSFGHWLLLPAVYHEGDSVLGCHYCPGLNHTEIGFYIVLRKALRTTLNSIIERRGDKGNGIDVIVTTFSPHHFEGEWDKAGACPKTKPYRNAVEARNERVNLRFESIPITQSSKSPPRHASPNVGEGLPLEPSEQKIMAYFDGINDGGSLGDNAGGHIDQNTSLKIKTKKKPSERKRGKAEKSISLDVLQHYFTGSLKDAAKSLGVCPTTMKRICRQHGISRWPSRKIKKVNRSLSKLKCVIESVHGAERAFGLNSLSTVSLPIAAGSFSEPSTSNKFNRQTSLTIRPSEPKINEKDFDASGASETKRQAAMEDQFLGLEARAQSPEKVINDRGVATQEIGTKGTNKFRTGSGSSESSGNPTPHGSCHGSPPNEISPPKDIFVTGHSEKCLVLRGSLGSTTLHSTSTPNCTTAYPMPHIVETTEPQELFGGQLLERAGSSKDLRNLCPSADAVLEDQVPEAYKMNPQCSDLPQMQHMDNLNNTLTPFAVRKEVKSVTIKATYKEDIIRFKVSMDCGIVELKEEIAKRLKLEAGTFDIKYLDDDHEWVLIACDADLQECMDISRSSGSNVIRLVVHDILPILGSSCESSGDWKGCI